MGLMEHLLIRSNERCELCTNKKDLAVFEVQPYKFKDQDSSILICTVCKEQIENPKNMNPNHWRCLNETIWSEYSPVKVMAWRILNQLKVENWTQELLEQMFLEDDILEWAKEGLPSVEDSDHSLPTIDSNGTKLENGDSVTLIKDLEVKGAGFTAKRGTLVKNISLTNNPKHIEGRVNGIQIVLVAAYLKKA